MAALRQARVLPGRLHAWSRGSRPLSLSASTIPVLIGTPLAADAHFSRWKGLAGAVLIHAGAELINDDYAVRTGADPRTPPGPAALSNAASRHPPGQDPAPPPAAG